MKVSANRAVETFLIITFPLALFAGCADNGETKPTEKQAMTQESIFDAEKRSDDSATASTMQLLADTLNAVNMRKDTDDRSTDSDSSSADVQEDGSVADTATDPAVSSDTTVAVAEESGSDSSIQDESSNVGQTGNTAVEAGNDQTQTTAENVIVADKSASDLDEDGKILPAKLTPDSSASVPGAMDNEPDLHIINFATDKADVDSTYLAELEQHARFLKANPDLTLTISGHADSRGSHDYNEKLSLERAQKIYKILLSYGAPEGQLIVDSFGDTSPLHSKGNYQENRRVELEYLDAVKMHLSVR